MHSFNYYSVAHGRKCGIFLQWKDAKASTNKFSNNKHQGFDDMVDAINFMLEHGYKNSEIYVYTSYDQCIQLDTYKDTCTSTNELGNQSEESGVEQNGSIIVDLKDSITAGVPRSSREKKKQKVDSDFVYPGQNQVTNSTDLKSRENPQPSENHQQGEISQLSEAFQPTPKLSDNSQPTLNQPSPTWISTYITTPVKRLGQSILGSPIILNRSSTTQFEDSLKGEYSTISNHQSTCRSSSFIAKSGEIECYKVLPSQVRRTTKG